VAKEISPKVAELQRAIKKTFDPNGILNPGKKI
jgi:glycolate oxidase